MELKEQKRSRILVIDDDEIMRDLLSTLLEVKGYEVTAVDSGLTALEKLVAGIQPEVILSDLQMPGLEGGALARALRGAADPGTVLLGMSGATPARETLAILDAFLPKPFDLATFEDTLERARSARADWGLSGEPKAMAVNNDTDREWASSSERATEASAPVLDERIFASLAGSIRLPQLEELYNLTLADIGQRYGRILQASAEDDLATARREAHAIKGSCGMVGARELEQLAAEIEGGTTLNTSVLADFPAACDRLRRMLDAKLQQ